MKTTPVITPAVASLLRPYTELLKRKLTDFSPTLKGFAEEIKKQGSTTVKSETLKALFSANSPHDLGRAVQLINAGHVASPGASTNSEAAVQMLTSLLSVLKQLGEPVKIIREAIKPALAALIRTPNEAAAKTYAGIVGIDDLATA